MKFLVVDDSSTMRRIIKNSLKRIGFEDIVEAENGRDGLEKFADVDIILTDWNMPEMDGLEFVKRVRATNTAIPILMVTTNAAKDDIVEALKNGVNNYIVKPFTPETLKEKVESVLK
ncbi:MAG: response regulator [bacterium]|nr:response regulator [bacterium]